MMESKWKANALNPQVQSGMSKVATSLSKGDGLAAERIQLSLSVDWPSLCGTWMIGVKHLVLNVKENQKASEEDSSGQEEGVKGIDKPL